MKGYLQIFMSIFILFITVDLQAKTQSYEDYAAQFAASKITQAKSFGELLPVNKMSSPGDKKKIEEAGATIQNLSSLKATATDNVVKVTLGQEELQIEFVDSYFEKYKFNGYAADLRQYKSLDEKIKYVERILGRKTSLNFRQKLFSELFIGEQAQAFLPLLIWGGIAVASWGTAAYEACSSGMICTSDESKIGSSVLSFARFIELKSSSNAFNVEMTCYGDKYIKVTDSEGGTVYDSRRPNMERNLDTGNSSYTTLVMDFNRCCSANKRKCEQQMKDMIRKIGQQSSSGSRSSGRGDGVN